MGGLDIFETMEHNGIWKDPVNLKSPINTPKDDFFFVLDSTNKAGFLSSNRDGTDQIHAFTMNEPLFYLDGLAFDTDERGLKNADIILTNLETGTDVTIMSGLDGKFQLQLEPNSDYLLKVSSKGMLASSTTVSTKGLTRNDTLHTTMRLSQVKVGEAIAIKNIYYDYDKWEIRPDASIELDRIARLFIDNPDMSFELGSHTDSRGGDLYNLVLSDARANSAVNYLIQRGVDPNRITAKGYGEHVLVNKCANGAKCTEEDHQANRRTEFKVTGIFSFGKYDFDKDFMFMNMDDADELLGLNQAFSGMEVVKFQHPLLPDEVVSLQIDWLKEKHRLVFRYSVGGSVASSGKITLCP